MAAVSDGCGGAGSLKYPSMGGRTGAYIAANVELLSLKLFFAVNEAVKLLIDRLLDLFR